MYCIDAGIMAALGKRFNRSIYGYRWSLAGFHGELLNATVSLSF
jgi:hypothetical protein